MSQPKTAIVTGAASGIGLALTKHLIAKEWRVVMADWNQDVGNSIAKELGDQAIFEHVNVADWDANVQLFKRAWDWSGRLDFLAANAGIDDKEKVLARTPEGQEPSKPNLQTIDVDYVAVLYQLKLFLHYARKNATPGGKMVITSSAAGLYPFEACPQYASAKHALIGLTRSIGPRLREEGITVNAICPAFVPTGLAPDGLIDLVPKEHITPLSTIVKAFETLIENDELSGEAVECSQDKLYFRKPVEFPNESQKWLNGDPDRFWSVGYKKDA